MGTWCAIVSDMKVAERLAEHFDGETRPTGEPSRIEVTVGVTEISILLAGANAVRLTWHRGESPGCDGASRTGHRCLCLASFQARRRAIRQGRGCEPRVRLEFRLLDAPTLGLFEFLSGDWSVAEEIGVIADRLPQDGGLIRAQLGLRRTSVALSSGQVVLVTRAAIVVPLLS
jgi:hypothetical protein